MPRRARPSEPARSDEYCQKAPPRVEVGRRSQSAVAGTRRRDESASRSVLAPGAPASSGIGDEHPRRDPTRSSPTVAT